MQVHGFARVFDRLAGEQSAQRRQVVARESERRDVWQSQFMAQRRRWVRAESDTQVELAAGDFAQ